MKKKLLVITLLFFMFTLTSCLIQDHIMVEVGQGLKNITEHDSYCIETDIYLNNPEETRDENAEPNGKYVITVDGTNTKHELVLGSLSYTYYTYVNEYGQTLMVYNANPFDPAQGTLWLSAETGVFDYEPDYDFLLEIDPMYFDLEEDVYTLNELGKENIKEWVENLIGENPYLSVNFNEQSTTKIYVDTEYVHAIKTNMVLLDFTNQEQIYEADLDISFTRFGEAIVTLPEDVMPLREFVLGMLSAVENGIEQIRQELIIAIKDLGDEFFDKLLNMEKDAMEQVKAILHEVLGNYSDLFDVIEGYLGELSQYVEIEGLLMELLEQVLEEYQGELENIEDLLDALQAQFEEEFEQLVVLFETLIEEYEEEIINAIIEKILELLDDLK